MPPGAGRDVLKRTCSCVPGAPAPAHRGEISGSRECRSVDSGDDLDPRGSARGDVDGPPKSAPRRRRIGQARDLGRAHLRG
ncbi:MAG: hypothetical protein ABI134_10390 [Byssovorax sp.]